MTRQKKDRVTNASRALDAAIALGTALRECREAGYDDDVIIGMVAVGLDVPLTRKREARE